jgi:tetratricopeptide (TPR) repeat protein
MEQVIKMTAIDRSEESLKESYKGAYERLVQKNEELTLRDIIKEDKCESPVAKHIKNAFGDAKDRTNLYEVLEKEKYKAEKSTFDNIFNDHIGGEPKDEDSRLALIRYMKGASSPEYKIAKAELLFEEKKFVEAADYYRQAGEFDQADRCLIVNGLVLFNKGQVDSAREFYKNNDISFSKMQKDVQEKVINFGLVYIDKGYVDSAITFYGIIGVYISQMPKNVQEKLLKPVREGNVTTTQKLASLVNSEEDEILFNEARAGMVL